MEIFRSESIFHGAERWKSVCVNSRNWSLVFYVWCSRNHFLRFLTNSWITKFLPLRKWIWIKTSENRIIHELIRILQTLWDIGFNFDWRYSLLHERQKNLTLYNFFLIFSLKWFTIIYQLFNSKHKKGKCLTRFLNLFWSYITFFPQIQFVYFLIKKSQNSLYQVRRRQNIMKEEKEKRKKDILMR